MKKKTENGDTVLWIVRICDSSVVIRFGKLLSVAFRKNYVSWHSSRFDSGGWFPSMDMRYKRPWPSFD